MENKEMKNMNVTANGTHTEDSHISKGELTWLRIERC